jgi:hypothetical protein
MRWRNVALVAVVLAGLVVAAVVAVGRGGGGPAQTVSPSTSGAAGWSGLVGEPRMPVGTGSRALVVLSAFSLADRVQRVGGLATDRDERRWSATALAAQQQFIASLARRGIAIKPEHRFTRTINGFSAVLDPRAIAVLERTRGVKGVYPMRTAYPASVSSRALRSGAMTRQTLNVRLAGIAGRGVTIALLDTGVDLRKAYLHGHVLDGIDVVGKGPDADAVSDPADSTRIEQHGTEMAGLLVGAGGPGGVSGVAPGATVLPIRAAGWQPDQHGGYAIYARTDQLLAGLERAVDPNGDGDAHDAARIALVPLVEPFAAFGDSPLARAVAGALRLDTLVVASAGNDGPAGPAFGSVGGPAGAPDALAVGAADARRTSEQVRIVVRAGLSVVLDRVVPLAGSVAPSRSLLLSPAAPRGRARSAQDFLDRGLSRVAGRAAVVPAGNDPAAVARWAADAGAAAVLLHGRSVAAGGIGLDERIDVPVLSIPETAAQTLLRKRGALVALAAPRTTTGAGPAVAPFSSWGLGFDGSVKPDLLAPGVGIVTSEPGATEDGAPAFGTVNGSSAAAAVVAGAAALLSEARPAADAETLRALLIEGATDVPGMPPAAQGAGLVDLGRSAAEELVVDSPSIAFGRGTGEGWQGSRVLRLRNTSTRKLTVFVSSGQRRRPRVPLVVKPRRLEIEPGATGEITVGTQPITVAKGASAAGVLTITPLAGTPVRVPWAVVLRPGGDLLGPLTLTRRTFKPSEQRPAVVVLRAGRVIRAGKGNAVVPVLRLDVELWSADGKRLGLVARLRDVLPGRYAFGLTGRGPGGKVLPAGRYRLRIFAWPTGGGSPDTRSVAFTIR